MQDISGDSCGDPHEHASGIYYLLVKRGVEQLASSTGFELLIFALMRLVSSYLYWVWRKCDSG